MGVQIFKNVEVLISSLADTIVAISKESIAKKGRFDFVLSGGSSPQKLYELLASEKYRNKIDWSKTFFFFGDERFVPEGDPERNSLMAKKSLLEALEISDNNIFIVDTSTTPSESANRYAKRIIKHFGGQEIIFDFVLLGLGDDAHTASLFPSTDVLDETESTIKSVFVKKLNTDRITMTAALINEANHIAFLVFGKNKAEAVLNVLENSKLKPEEFPAKLIHPKKGNLSWFIDDKAGSLLDSY